MCLVVLKKKREREKPLLQNKETTKRFFKLLTGTSLLLEPAMKQKALSLPPPLNILSETKSGETREDNKLLS